MVDLRTDWTDNIGMQVDAAYLNSLDTAVNANTHAQPMADTWANRPAAATGNTGALYFCTDNNVLYKSNGSAWSPIRISGDSCDAMGTPPTSGWTAVNMPVGGTWASSLDAMLLTMPSTGTANNVAYQYISYPAAPFTLTMYFNVDLQTLRGYATGTGYFSAGGGISDGTKLITFGLTAVPSTTDSNWDTGGTYNVGAVQWTNVTTFSSAYNSQATSVNRLGYMPSWWRFIDDNTNRKIQYSKNGIDWHTLVSESRTTFLTPTRLCVAANNFSGSTGVLRLRSWKIA